MIYKRVNLSLAFLLLLASCNTGKTADNIISEMQAPDTFNGKDITHEFDAEIDSIIAQMTLEEK